MPRLDLFNSSDFNFGKKKSDLVPHWKLVPLGPVVDAYCTENIKPYNKTPMQTTFFWTVGYFEQADFSVW